MHAGQYRTLESLQFDNTAIKVLPIDPIKDNYVRRSVSGACFSLVDPTPVSNPTYVTMTKMNDEWMMNDGLIMNK